MMMICRRGLGKLYFSTESSLIGMGSSLGRVKDPDGAPDFALGKGKTLYGILTSRANSWNYFYQLMDEAAESNHPDPWQKFETFLYRNHPFWTEKKKLRHVFMGWELALVIFSGYCLLEHWGLVGENDDSHH